MISIILALAAAANCSDPQTNAEIGECALVDYKRADAEMNRQWRITLAAMKTADKNIEPGDHRLSYSAALLTAQRAWLVFRDAHCVTEGYLMRGGSGEPSLIVSCKTSLTQARAKQLRDLAEGL